MNNEKKLKVIDCIRLNEKSYIKPNGKYNISKISQDTKIDRKTISKYINNNPLFFKKSQYKKRMLKIREDIFFSTNILDVSKDDDIQTIQEEMTYLVSVINEQIKNLSYSNKILKTKKPWEYRE
ncbi:hypothetical protein [Poseidonibacter sp.]|uniref:hypothetical protein n=1 Tax=Poseidonibacter sp. TaxID=2321188 RepID=UPI003C71787E